MHLKGGVRYVVAYSWVWLKGVLPITSRLYCCLIAVCYLQARENKSERLLIYSLSPRRCRSGEALSHCMCPIFFVDKPSVYSGHPSAGKQKRPLPDTSNRYSSKWRASSTVARTTILSTEPQCPTP